MIQVTFVGVIREVHETATNISYKIDDMTGNRISVKKWIDNDVSFHLSLYLLCDFSYIFYVEMDQSFYQGFIQAILMSGRQQKKLNLRTELSNSIFIKAHWH